MLSNKGVTINEALKRRGPRGNEILHILYGNLRNHLTEHLTAPVRYQFYKISKEIQQ